MPGFGNKYGIVSTMGKINLFIPLWKKKSKPQVNHGVNLF